MTVDRFFILESWKKGNKAARKAHLVKLVKSKTLESLLKRRKYSKAKNPSKVGKYAKKESARFWEEKQEIR